MIKLSAGIRRLPFRDGDVTRFVSVRFVPMDMGLIGVWRRRVQTIINTQYSRYDPSQTTMFTRADVGWDWRKIYAGALVHSMFVKPVVAFCLVIDGPNSSVFR